MNPHALRRRNLNPVRLPIPPLVLGHLRFETRRDSARGALRLAKVRAQCAAAGFGLQVCAATSQPFSASPSQWPGAQWLVRQVPPMQPVSVLGKVQGIRFRESRCRLALA